MNKGGGAGGALATQWTKERIKGGGGEGRWACTPTPHGTRYERGSGWTSHCAASMAPFPPPLLSGHSLLPCHGAVNQCVPPSPVPSGHSVGSVYAGRRQRHPAQHELDDRRTDNHRLGGIQIVSAWELSKCAGGVGRHLHRMAASPLPSPHIFAPLRFSFSNLFSRTTHPPPPPPPPPPLNPSCQRSPDAPPVTAPTLPHLYESIVSAQPRCTAPTLPHFIHSQIHSHTYDPPKPLSAAPVCRQKAVTPSDHSHLPTLV